MQTNDFIFSYKDVVFYVQLVYKSLDAQQLQPTFLEDSCCVNTNTSTHGADPCRESGMVETGKNLQIPGIQCMAMVNTEVDKLERSCDINASNNVQMDI